MYGITDTAASETFASKLFPKGCQCGNNGGGDCDWCLAKQDWLMNPPEWRKDAMEGL